MRIIFPDERKKWNWKTLTSVNREITWYFTVTAFGFAGSRKKCGWEGFSGWRNINSEPNETRTTSDETRRKWKSTKWARVSRSCDEVAHVVFMIDRHRYNYEGNLQLTINVCFTPLLLLLLHVSNLFLRGKSNCKTTTERSTWTIGMAPTTERI